MFLVQDVLLYHKMCSTPKVLPIISRCANVSLRSASEQGVDLPPPAVLSDAGVRHHCFGAAFLLPRRRSHISSQMAAIGTRMRGEKMIR